MAMTTEPEVEAAGVEEEEAVEAAAVAAAAAAASLVSSPRRRDAAGWPCGFCTQSGVCLGTGYTPSTLAGDPRHALCPSDSPRPGIVAKHERPTCACVPDEPVGFASCRADECDHRLDGCVMCAASKLTSTANNMMCCRSVSMGRDGTRYCTFRVDDFSARCEGSALPPPHAQ